MKLRLSALALGATMMFESWGYMMPQQDPTDTLILVNKTNKAPTVPVTLVKPNVPPTKETPPITQAAMASSS